MRRAAVVALALLLGACTTQDTGRPARGETEAITLPAGRCSGVTHAEVRGRPPAHPGHLQDYRASGAVCDAWWIPAMESGFVPQGLEVAGGRAFVSGYLTAAPGERACQVVVVDLAEGRQVSRLPRFEAPVHGPTPTYCRHGGGNELTRHGLWVAGGQVLWLLDPGRLDSGAGGGDPVLRAWRLEGLMGSTMAVHRDRLVIGTFRVHGPGRLLGFDLDEVLAPGADLLAQGEDVPGAVAPAGLDRVPPRLQGLTATGAGRWQVSARVGCGRIDPPGPRGPHDFVPGSEDVEVHGRDVWTVSEASAHSYRDPRAGLVPGLLRLDRRALLAGGPATCSFD